MQRPLLLAVFLLALSACSDPYEREGTWRTGEVNQANLRAMVAQPTDLKWGRSQPDSDGQMAAAAVTRLRTGALKPLLNDAISKIGGGGSGGGETPAPAAGAGSGGSN